MLIRLDFHHGVNVSHYVHIIIPASAVQFSGEDTLFIAEHVYVSLLLCPDRVSVVTE